MKMKIIFLIIIIISTISFSKEYKSSKIFFKKNIIKDLSGSNALFINNTEIIFQEIIDNKIHKIFVIDIDNNKKINLKAESNLIKDDYYFNINRIGKLIYITINLGSNIDKFILKNNHLINYKLEKYNLINDYYFDYYKGIFIKSSDKILVDNYQATFATPPIISKIDDNNIYWLTDSYEYESLLRLNRYNIKEKKVDIIYDGVICFSIIPNDPDYLLIFAQGSKYHFNEGYLHGDFIIIKNNGEVVKNFDKEHYDLGEEYFIDSFDINENNEIIVDGGYLNYSKNIYIPNTSQSGLLLLELKEDNIKNVKSKIIFFTPNVDNLRFRASPDLQGKFIRSLIKGEKLELIEKGKTETIQGIKGTWIKVKTEKGEVGWCFDAYLEEVKN